MGIRLLIGSLVLAQALTAGYALIEIESPPDYHRLNDFTRTTISNALPDLKNLVLSDTIHIRYKIVSSQAGFRSAVGAGLPHWANAVTLFPQKLVVIQTPDLSRTTLRDYRTTVIHELVHLLQGQSVPLNLTPVWLNEGLAEFYAGEFDYSERVVLSRALFRRRLIPLNNLERVLTFSHPRAELAYAESAAAVEFLIDVYGTETIRAILRGMRDGSDFGKALEQTTGSEYADFQDHWRTYLAHKYNWIFLLDIQNILWLIIPGLAFLAFVSIRRRNKRTIRQWNDEETQAGMDEENN